MIGAIIGDTIGSRFEWKNHKSKEFDLFTRACMLTDDSIMTLAVAKSILECKSYQDDLSEITVKNMQAIGKKYTDAGYGGHFRRWIYSSDPAPYNSYGNGAAMRVSPCGFVARNLDEALLLADKVTEVTHNHPEGMKGAEATACAIYLAREGKSIEEIKQNIEDNYYQIDFTLDEIRDTYKFDVSCQGSIPQALEAFYESSSFEDAIRNAVSIGGDSDTIAAITGGIAEAYYGVPAEIREQMLSFMDSFQIQILNEFEFKYKGAKK